MICAPKFFQNVLRHSLHRGNRAYRHEYRRFDFGMRRKEAAGARLACGFFNLEGDGHSLGL